MSLNIKNEETHQMASELAQITGQTMTQAVTEAIRRTLEEEKRKRGREGLAKRILEIGRRAAPYVDDSLTSSNIGDHLYDDEGLPK